MKGAVFMFEDFLDFANKFISIEEIYTMSFLTIISILNCFILWLLKQYEKRLEKLYTHKMQKKVD